MSGSLHSEFPYQVVVGLGPKTGLPLGSNIHKNITFTTSNMRFYEIVVTAYQRSLGQGNIFSSVCQEFCPWGDMLLGVCLVQGRVPGPGGGLVPRGAWSQGAVWSGGCLVLGGAWSQGSFVRGQSRFRQVKFHSQETKTIFYHDDDFITLSIQF